MFLIERDIEGWKNDMNDYQHKRKNVQWQSQEPTKHVTYRDVKTKDAEYNPIMQKYRQNEKEEMAITREKFDFDRVKNKSHAKAEKYDQPYDIITQERREYVNRPMYSHEKPKIIPATQVDYNIVTNEKLSDMHYRNTIRNVGDIKKEYSKPTRGMERDYNIISNKYNESHDNKVENDRARNDDIIRTKYNSTHNYNLLVGEYYDPEKEQSFKNKREEEQEQHGRDKLEKLPPSIKNREALVFDPTKEVPEAIKKIDIQKKNAKKRYETRYELEKEMKERDYEQQERDETRKMYRIHEQKYFDEYEKGYDLLSLEPKDVSKMSSAASKPHHSNWEKIMKTSSNYFPSNEGRPGLIKKAESQTFATRKSHVDAKPAESIPARTASDIKPLPIHEPAVTQHFGQDTRKRETISLAPARELRVAVGSDNEAASRMQAKAVSLPFAKSIADDFQHYKTNQFKKLSQPVYNLADKYTSLVKPPQFSRERNESDIKALPPIGAQTGFNFKTISTGSFNRAST